MIKNYKYIIGISFLLLPTALFAWQGSDFWLTPNQQGAKLLKAGKAKEAAKMFENKDWKATALYRSGDYKQALTYYSKKNTSDNQYNAGNALAHLGRFQEAIGAYDKALALNPNNTDAIANRDLIKKLMDKKKQAENNSSKNDKTSNKKNDSKENGDNSSPSQQNSKQNNLSKNKDEKQTEQTNPEKSKQLNANQKNEESNSSQDQAQNNGEKPEDKKFNSNQQNDLASKAFQNKDEDKKQLLRRVTDDPGGLLQQKFLRDYYRRHTVSENQDSGEN